MCHKNCIIFSLFSSFCHFCRFWCCMQYIWQFFQWNRHLQSRFDEILPHTLDKKWRDLNFRRMNSYIPHILYEGLNEKFYLILKIFSFSKTIPTILDLLLTLWLILNYALRFIGLCKNLGNLFIGLLRLFLSIF